jgi:hypothetical protein
MIGTSRSLQAAMNQDRRQYPRLIPDSALLVSVDKLRRGFLCDLSEGGVAFEGLVCESGPNVISLAFDLPDGGGSIEAVGEVVWTCDSLHRTGVRFLELAETSRQQLRDWLSRRVVTLDGGEEGGDSGISLRGVTDAARNWILQEIGDARSSEDISGGHSNLRESGNTGDAMSGFTSYRVASIVLGLALLSSAFVTVGYYLPALFPAPKAISRISTSESSVRFSPDGSLARVSQVSGAVPSRYEGFVLQVGAMAHKENADALAEKLHQKSFPAFVFDRGSDGLYRVNVGPYPDADYARGVKDELASAGFRTVLQRRLSH